MTESEYRALSLAERLRVTIRNAKHFFDGERAAVSINTEEFGTLSREQVERAIEVDDARTLTDDERALMTHVSMFGADGYPVRKVGSRHWSWDFRSCQSKVVFPRKRDAVESFEKYHECLRGYYGAESFRRAVCSL